MTSAEIQLRSSARLVARKVLRCALALTIFVALAGASMYRSLLEYENTALTDAVVARSSIEFDATLMGDPKVAPYSASALVKILSVKVDGEQVAASGTRVLARASGPDAMRLGLLEAGDLVSLTGFAAPLTGRDASEKWRHVIGRVDVTEFLGAKRPTSLLARVSNRLRSLIAQGNSSLSDRQRSLTAGFLLGDTRGLNSKTRDDFRAAGLSHLLAVSGANLAFVLAMVSAALDRCRLSARLIGGIATVVIFGAMTRWEPSVMRASAMAALSLWATYTGRPAQGRRIFAIAVGGLVLVDPFLICRVGFLLSCGATAGILLFSAPIARRLRGPEWLREGIALTAAAELGISPVALSVFGTIPLVALPANLLAVPLVGPITVWGMVGGALGGLLGGHAPSVVAVMAIPTGLLANAAALVAQVAARAPLAIDIRGLVVLIVVLVAASRLRRTIAASGSPT